MTRAQQTPRAQPTPLAQRSARGRAAQQVVDCKFEDCDARNGARIVGMDDLAHVVGTPVDAAFG